MNKTMALSEKEVTNLTRSLAKEIWNISFDLPITFSGRMTSTLGYFQRKYDYISGEMKPHKIQFSKHLINGNYKLETVESVIKHELTHWYIYTTIGEGYRDGEYEFEQELKRIGSHSTHTIKRSGNLYIGICEKCGKIVIKKRTEKSAINACNKYISGCCNKKIIYKGLLHIEDNTSTLPSSIQINSSEEILEEKVPEEKVANEIKDEQINQQKNKSNLDINEIVKPGKKGVTRTQVHPALVNAIDNKMEQVAKLIKESYPEYYSQCCKYLNKKRLTWLNEIGI